VILVFLENGRLVTTACPPNLLF